MKISARNTFKGTVKEINRGAVNNEVVIELAGGQKIVSIITDTACNNLELATGKPVYAVIKASNVMVAVDH